MRDHKAMLTAHVLTVITVSLSVILGGAQPVSAGACYGENGPCVAECPYHCTLPECLPPTKCDCQMANSDVDADGFLDGCDNCVAVPNPTQQDTDRDGLGDECDSVSSMVYILALGGENHGGAASFSPGDPGDRRTFSAGSVITWEVRVLASGIHNNPGGGGHYHHVVGAAAILFSLELHEVGTDGTEGGLVAFGPGSSGSGGWFSRINDGSTGPLQYAAFCRVFNMNNDSVISGRLIDALSLDGPGMCSFQYPALVGVPSSTTTGQGQLTRMGAAYHSWNAAEQATGVGLVSNIGNCIALGAMPLFEGQMNTQGLSAGRYLLKVVPVSQNIFVGAASCSTPSSIPWILAPNNVLGDTLSFQLSSP